MSKGKSHTGKRPLLSIEEVQALARAQGPHRATPHARATPMAHVPTGAPRDRGMLSNFIAKTNPHTAPVTEDGLVYVSVEGMHPRKAVLDAADFKRITGNKADSPMLTRSRWWQDANGMLYAYTLRERSFEHGVLVAAAILNAREGDTIECAGDPFDLRL